jgi:hypothetical protein
MYRLKRRDLQAGRAPIGIADQHFIHAETTGVEGTMKTVWPLCVTICRSELTSKSCLHTRIFTATTKETTQA